MCDCRCVPMEGMFGISRDLKYGVILIARDSTLRCRVSDFTSGRLSQRPWAITLLSPEFMIRAQSPQKWVQGAWSLSMAEGPRGILTKSMVCAPVKAAMLVRVT